MSKPVAPPVCAYTHDGVSCRKRGDHLCKQRGDHVVAFFAEILVHTKGRWARHPFILARWQEHEIIRPLFGTVGFDETTGAYVRRYRIAYLSCARKNGKTEALAGIALYLLVADGEESAEVYGCAVDRDQARKVFDVALRMVQLSPVLSRRITPKEHAKRLVDERSASYYEILAADAAGNLGHNPSGVVFDELLTQKDDRLYSAMRTAMGAREQPLMVMATTAGDDPDAWPQQQRKEFERIAEDPSRAPHVFVWIRATPADADPFDEANWPLANPALGDFLSLQALRDEAMEARADATKENAFRQYRLNQVVAQASRWMPLHVYDACAGEPWPKPDWRRDALANREAFGGLDLAARLDLCAWCIVLPDDVTDVAWRFWLPENALPELDMATGGQASLWVRDGWLTITDGDVLDYDRVYADMELDAHQFAFREVAYDPWSGEPVVQELAKRFGRRVDFLSVPQTYTGLSPGMNELMALSVAKRWAHHGNPVARFCFDSVEVRRARDEPDLIRPVKPARNSTGKRIDGVVTAAMAVAAWKRARPQKRGGVAAF
jgi:phage terminase large subunit-like protein